METFKSRKFIMALVGIGLCVLWAAIKLDEKYLITALGFVAVYTAGNVAEGK